MAPPGGTDDGYADVAAIIAAALPGGMPPDTLRGTPSQVVTRLTALRASGLVRAGLDVGSGSAWADWPDDARAALDALHLAELRSSLAVESVAVTVARQLERAGVPYAITKGCATAHLDYPDPAERVSGDVDLLVARADFPGALESLASIGYGRMEPPFRARWEHRYAKDIPLINEVHVEVDVHLALATGHFGVAMNTDPLLAHTTTFTVGGHHLRALDATGRLIHATIHSAAGTAMQLASAADVAMIGGRPDHDHSALVSRLAATGAGAIVARGVTRVWDTFRLSPTELSEWAAAYPYTTAERSALEALTRPGGEGRWASGLTALPWRERPRYLLPLLLPDREFLRARGRTRAGHIKLSLRRLTRQA